MSDPDEAEEAGGQIVPGRLCVWRILGLTRNFTDRPDDLAAWTTAGPGPKPADSLDVTIGEIPQHVLEGIRSSKALAMLAAGSMFGNRFEGWSLEQRDAHVAALMAEDDDGGKSVRGTFPNWLTLEVARPLDVMAR